MKKVIVLFLFSLACFVLYYQSNNVIEEIPKISVLEHTINTESASFEVVYPIPIVCKLFKNEVLIFEKTLNGVLKIDNLDEDTDYILSFETPNEVITKSFRTKRNTTIRFGGDVMMTSFFADYISRYGVDYMWEDVSDLFKSADYALINLETSVSTRGASNKPEGFGFRSDPSTLKGLTNAGIDFVTVANNHIFDYGIDAFRDTLYHLEQNSIAFAGAGNNIEEAFAVVYKKVNDVDLAFISATSVMGSLRWEALENQIGVAALKESNYSLLRSKITEASKKSDHVIVNLHWGIEYENYPKQSQVDLAHSLIDSGASIIIGHHPHVLQGVEHYKDGIIFYSVGNFNFLISTDNTMQTALFEVNLNKEKISSSKLYPIKINSCKANLLSKEHSWYGEIINNINVRSSSFNTSVDNIGNISKIN